MLPASAACCSLQVKRSLLFVLFWFVLGFFFLFLFCFVFSREDLALAPCFILGWIRAQTKPDCFSLTIGWRSCCGRAINRRIVWEPLQVRQRRLCWGPLWLTVPSLRIMSVTCRLHLSLHPYRRPRPPPPQPEAQQPLFRYPLKLRNDGKKTMQTVRYVKKQNKTGASPAPKSSSNPPVGLLEPIWECFMLEGISWNNFPVAKGGSSFSIS